MYEAQQIGGFWYVCQDGRAVGTWMVGRMPNTRQECEDAARRMNDGATIRELPRYGEQDDMRRIVARAPWGDTYSAMDAENGCVPSEAYEVEVVE